MKNPICEVRIKKLMKGIRPYFYILIVLCDEFFNEILVSNE